MWAREPSLDPTTTNNAESFHYHYNDDHTAKHPNIHKTALALIRVQTENYVDMRSLHEQALPSKKQERKFEMMQEARSAMLRGDRSILSYLRFSGRLNHALKKKGNKN